MGFFILGAVAPLAWLSRLVENIPALGGGTPTSSPRGAIGWWFVAIAILCRPDRIAADARRRLAPSAAEALTGLVLAGGCSPDPTTLILVRRS